MPDVGGTQMPGGHTPGAGGRAPKIVGFLCDWAVSAEGLVHPDGRMRDLPHVTLIKVPCSGFIRPAWLEFALRNGAEGAFVCGCPLGDCFNRYGNNLIGERVAQMRRRLERQRIHPDRVATLYYGLHQQSEFVAAVRAFADKVARLPGPVVPPPARPAAARAGAAPAGAGSSTPPSPDPQEGS